MLKAGTVYLFGVGTTLKLLDMMLQGLDLPNWTMRTLAIALFSGLPVVVYRAWRRGEDPGDSHESDAQQRKRTEPPPERSVAVLPFVNMSADVENEYFSDGLSEELLNLLAKIPELRVAARTSSFSFKGDDVDISTVGEQLNVAHVLEGSVRKSGSTLRITARFIRATDGYQMWSETYDRRLDDIFAIQDEIAAAVVDQLKVALLGVEPIQVVARPTTPQAFESYLQGRDYYTKSTRADFELAMAEYEKAIVIDPDYAPAWAAKALTLIRMAGYGFLPFEEGFRDARLAAEHAIELDPQLDAAYRALGEVMERTYDFVGSRAAVHRALELGPGDASNIGAWADSLATAGEMDEAAFEMRRAAARDPLAIRVLSTLAFQQIQLMHLEQAGRTLEQIRAIDPDDSGLNISSSYLALQTGDLDQMLEFIEFFPAGFEYLQQMHRAVAYHRLGDLQKAQENLDELIEINGEVAAYQVAVVYSYWGDADKTFEWLDRAVELHDPGVTEVNKTSFFDPVKDDPRWDAFLERIGLKAVMAGHLRGHN
jgi:TolB-like protein/Tfp pilus assembly protein PilF